MTNDRCSTRFITPSSPIPKRDNNENTAAAAAGCMISSFLVKILIQAHKYICQLLIQITSAHYHTSFESTLLNAIQFPTAVYRFTPGL